MKAAHSSILIAALISSPMAALADGAADLLQDAHIEADRVILDERAKTATYIGNVRYRQGSISIAAEQAILHWQGEAVATVKLEGTPARFEQRDDSGQLIKAQAQQIEYQRRTQQLLLLQQARLERQQLHIEAARISYDIGQQQLRSEGQQGRVETRLKMPPPAAP